ncbi:hypothetical protein [Piscirickettsia litoralis]|uniref:DUF2235 domain-containing protein n=1 Tax=Piscirickettsia litoralis TaxID=1891921 RepID=A0ABX3A5H0_9GAMM|nr:hypothetical protein [Piscirickettsia litoralis]ODN42680.1 hypothetical protein BGC07_06795 [Piscirickettsia litoralis]
MYLDIYFDGTGVNLNSSSEQKFGKSVVGYVFTKSPAEEVFIDPENNGKLRIRGDSDDASRNPYEPQHVKIYFPGPSAKTCTYQGQQYLRPGEEYNPTKISSLLLSQDTTTNRSGRYGDGWEHNLQHAVIVALNFILVRLQQNPDEPIIVRLRASYSRGGITAIAFSQLLSELLEEMGFPDDKVFIEEVNAIDPVAGEGYGKLQETAKRSKIKNDLHLVNATRIGNRTRKFNWYGATEEKRKAFEAQAPEAFATDRAILIPDNVECVRHFKYGCHKSTGHPLRLGVPHQAGIEIFEEISALDFDVPDGKETTWKHMADESYLRKRQRVFSQEASTESPAKSENYTNSILYDVFQYFMHGCEDKVTFEQALKEAGYYFNPTLVWAYKNSNFFRITGLAISDLTSELIAQAVHCKSRLDLVLFAIRYNQDPSSQHYAVATNAQVEHQALEAIIAAPRAEQETFLAQHTSPFTSLEKDQQVALGAVHNAMARLRANSAKEKMPHLTSAEEQIKKAADKKSCVAAVAKAEAAAKQRTARFSSARSKQDSQDYRTTDFEKAKEHFYPTPSDQPCRHPDYNQASPIFDQLSDETHRPPPNSVRLLAHVELLAC